VGLLSLKGICTVLIEHAHVLKEESNAGNEMILILNFMRRVWDDFIIHILSTSDLVFSPYMKQREQTFTLRVLVRIHMLQFSRQKSSL
jgi:hypothetical protein